MWIGSVYGIWIFEEDHRDRIGRAMLNLSGSAATAESIKSAPQVSVQPEARPSEPATILPTANQSISLDMLFSAATIAAVPPALPGAAQKPVPPQQSPPNKGLDLLESIFKTASDQQVSPRPQPAAMPVPPAAAIRSNEQALLEMLGLPIPSSTTTAAPPKPIPRHVPEQHIAPAAVEAARPDASPRQQTVSLTPLVDSILATGQPTIAPGLSRRDFAAVILNKLYVSQLF